MKRISKLFSLLMVLAIFCTSIPLVEANAATKTTEILFIGNSKTKSYGSPAKTFEALANKNGKNVNVTVCAEGGRTLKYLANNADYRAIMQKKSYDYVVMQEGIRPYLGSTTADYNKYVEGVNTIVNIIKKKNPNAKFFIRQVWVGKEYGTKDQIYGGGQSTGKFYIRPDETCTTAEKTRAYNNTEKIAKSVNATVIYDGWVMGGLSQSLCKPLN